MIYWLLWMFLFFMAVPIPESVVIIQDILAQDFLLKFIELLPIAENCLTYTYLIEGKCY